MGSQTDLYFPGQRPKNSQDLLQGKGVQVSFTLLRFFGSLWLAVKFVARGDILTWRSLYHLHVKTMLTHYLQKAHPPQGDSVQGRKGK